MNLFIKIFLILLFATMANGQKAAELQKLKLTFKIKKNKVCNKESLNFKAYLTNSSKESLVIDSKRIGSMFFFTRLSSENKPDLDNSFATGFLTPFHYKPDFVLLKPNDSYTKAIVFNFNNEFFDFYGDAEMMIGYQQLLTEKFQETNVWIGTIFSNNLNIHLNKCNSKLSF